MGLLVVMIGSRTDQQCCPRNETHMEEDDGDGGSDDSDEKSFHGCRLWSKAALCVAFHGKEELKTTLLPGFSLRPSF